jgi:hypothetical protein
MEKASVIRSVMYLRLMFDWQLSSSNGQERCNLGNRTKSTFTNRPALQAIQVPKTTKAAGRSQDWLLRIAC